MREHTEARLEKEWNELYERIKLVLQKFGENDYDRRCDYYLVDEMFSSYLQQVQIHKLHMLRPEIVKALQALLVGYPDWEIEISVAPLDKDDIWPRMELILRDNEIIDKLKRELFPKEYQDIFYEGSRPPKELGL